MLSTNRTLKILKEYLTVKGIETSTLNKKINPKDILSVYQPKSYSELERQLRTLLSYPIESIYIYVQLSHKQILIENGDLCSDSEYSKSFEHIPGTNLNILID